VYFFIFYYAFDNNLYCAFSVLCHVFCDRKEKELMKALETPEEKRARRLAKKVLFCHIFNLIVHIFISLCGLYVNFVKHFTQNVT